MAYATKAKQKAYYDAHNKRYIREHREELNLKKKEYYKTHPNPEKYWRNNVMRKYGIWMSCH